MAHDKEFDAFIEEARRVGLADVKALEAAWDQFAALVPETGRGREFREKLMNLLKLGAEYARLEDEARKEGVHRG